MFLYPMFRFFINMLSLISSLSFAVISPIVGFGLDKIGTQSVCRIIGFVSIAGIIGLFLLRKRQKTNFAG
ncbi:MAG: hypothetical protein U9N62_03225 [Thermotogota bacterium]|nr:hypothetical protein [Thermotogota bacterium]